jgi:hypothetical protein
MDHESVRFVPDATMFREGKGGLEVKICPVAATATIFAPSSEHATDAQ